MVHHAGSLNEIFKISGKTQEGKIVLKGVFEITSSIGLPLIILLTIIKEQGYVVDWVNYYEAALKHGMQSDRILLRISSDVSDIYGNEYRDEVIKRLQFFKNHTLYL